MLTIFVDVVLLALSGLLALKSASMVHGLVFLMRHGGEAMRYTRRKYEVGIRPTWSEIEISFGHQRLFSRQVKVLQGLGRTGKLLWTTYKVVPIVSGITLLAAGLADAVPLLAAGVSAALAAFILAISAVFKRFVLGSFDIIHWDLVLPPWMDDWAVEVEPGTKRSIFFILVTALVVFGFAALFCGLNAVQAGAFGVEEGVEKTAYGWLYFSLVTLGTVGLGDMFPKTLMGQIVVSLEIVCGPILLSWLIAAYLSGPSVAGYDSRPSPSDQQRGACPPTDPRSL
jgi:hypothetical protein